MKTLHTWLLKTVLALVISLGLLSPLLVAQPAAAACTGLFCGAKGQACEAVQAGNGSGQCDPDKLGKGQSSLTQTLTKLLNLLTMIVGIMTVIMLIISGIRFVTANGNSDSISSAKNTLIYALVGLIIVAFAQAIVKLILTRIS